MALQNFKIRTLITILGIPALVALTLFTAWSFAVFFIIAGGIVLHEIFKAVAQQDLAPNSILGYALYLAVIMVIVGEANAFLVALLYFGIIALFMVELFRKKPRVFENLAVTFTGAVFMAIVISTFILLRNIDYAEFQGWGNYGSHLILSVFFSVWVCDMVAYFIGSLLGRHKIFPRVSPNKTWEGTLSGLFGALATIFILQQTGFIAGLAPQHLLVLGLISGGFGQVGDFTESLVKRDVGIKDSSHLIPGHGGAWDRLDSLLFAVPLSYLYLNLVALA